MKMALRVSGVIFAVVALAHALRMVFHVEIQIENYMVPMRISLVGATAGLVLAVWMFKTAASGK